MSQESNPERLSGGEAVGHFLPIGIGVAIGVFAVPGWGFFVIAAALALSAGHVALRSTHYRAYQAQLENRGSNVVYFLQAAAWDTVKIGVVAFLSTLVRNAITT